MFEERERMKLRKIFIPFIYILEKLGILISIISSLILIGILWFFFYVLMGSAFKDLYGWLKK